MFPAMIVGGAVLVIETSALVETVVLAVELLLPALLSEVVEVTVAVLLMVDPEAVDGATLATTVNVALAAGASVAIEQETVAPVEQVNAGPLLCISETNEVPAGSVSLQLTLTAFEGPPFETVMV